MGAALPGDRAERQAIAQGKVRGHADLDQIVRQLADKERRPCPAREGRRPRANLLGPTALGFRHRDDVVEISRLLGAMGIDVHGAPMGASGRYRRAGSRPISNVLLYPKIGLEAARLAGEDLWPEVHQRRRRSAWRRLRRRGGRNRRCRGAGRSRCRPHVVVVAVDRFELYSTGKRVFIFGDASHAVAGCADRARRARLRGCRAGLLQPGIRRREFAPWPRSSVSSR